MRVGDLKLPARVKGDALALAKDGTFAKRFWPGVNLGVTTPGHQPGEHAPTRRDFDRWLAGMHDLGVRVVRVYTILRPQFYEALAAHNRRHPDAPLYFIQGVWIPEDEFVALRDAYAPVVTRGFDRELDHAVAAVHGDVELSPAPGHASGRYTTDVSRWLLAWSPGVEWDAHASAATDRRHRGMTPFEGRYIAATRKATPMESWLAARLDHLASLDAARGWSRPVTFTNWLTTDPLRHPSEPMHQEDMVGIDAQHLRATARWPGGFFASYHVYPYYPDFLTLEPAYREAKDPYAAYLRELKAHHHDRPVMVTEFGVPSGPGAAHRGLRGRDQGDHSEAEAGRLQAGMLRAIEDENYAGGILFEWTDEWFKRTWNTMDFELPADRRALWQNPYTNEEHFGVIASEPGRRPVVTVDGRAGEWDGNGSRRLFAGSVPARELRATHDPKYLYLLVRRDDPRRPLQLGFDVQPGGNRGLPGRRGVMPEADVSLTLGPGRRAEVMQAAWTDPNAQLYGAVLRYLPVDPADLEMGSGAWRRPLQVLSRPLEIRATGERRPTQTIDASRLRWGTAAPAARGFDSRVLASGDGATVELRLPWALLGYSDPSSHQVLVSRRDGTFASRTGGAIAVGLAGKTGPLAAAGSYDWRDWESVEFHERRKAGWPALRRAMARTARR